MTSTRFVGIDISKATFDVAFSADLRAVYSNDPAGFTQFRQALADDDHVVISTEPEGRLEKSLAREAIV